MTSSAVTGLIEALDAAHLGPDLANLVANLDPSACTESERIAVAGAWQRLSAWAEAGLAQSIVDVMGPEPESESVLIDDRVLILTDMTRHELGAVLRLTPGQVRNRIRHARTLVVDLPSVHQEMAEGRITGRLGGLFVDAAHRMALGIDLDDPETRAEHEARLLALCESVLPSAVRSDERTLARRLRHAVSRIDADGALRRSEAARRHCTGVTIHHEDDGISVVTATLPTEQAIACLAVIDALADANHSLDPKRPIGMLRAQAFVDVITAAGTVVCTACGAVAEAIAAPASRGVHVDLVMDLTTFLGLNDDPVGINGAGAIPASLARVLIADDPDATMRRLIVDPISRRLLDRSPDRYAIGPRIRRFLEVRDQRCRFPGCTKRAQRCDIDHARAFQAGGTSVVENMGSLCRAHHQAKTHGGWRITRSDSSGDCTWVSPQGRSFEHITEPALASAADEDCGQCTAYPAPSWRSPIEHHAAHVLDAAMY